MNIVWEAVERWHCLIANVGTVSQKQISKPQSQTHTCISQPELKLAQITIKMDQSSTIKLENVPLGSQDAQLEDLFCDFGPIKRCFVVKPKKPAKNKTIGYVQFLRSEDASAALAAAAEKGVELDGHDLKVKAAMDKGDKVEEASQKEKSQREFDKKAAKAKKARLIVRNLSFKATDESLKQHFETEGTKLEKRHVVDVNILKKPDGKMVGCGFIQFQTVAEAADAIKNLNGKPYLKRPIAVDWAVAKKDFKQGSVKEEEAGDEEENDKNEIKEEPMDEDEESAKEEQETSDSDEASDDENEEPIAKQERKDWPKTGHDVGENKTVFIRNLSFESDQDDLKAMLEDNFGKVLFARLVMDKTTNHPKGTAFVKFATEESAAECSKVSAGSEGIFLDGRRIYCMEAITKDKADETAKIKKEKRAKDTRNLYLAREGLVREGTLAAEGVSKQDMAKRAQLNKWKKGVLKDLNMFVSPVRLCVRNLPNKVTDKTLRVLIKKHSSDANAKITECKIMRDLKSAGKKGEAPSKGYGFITFTEHESALNALRKLNNNPDVFKKDQRPIVEFSIENRKALLARQKRLEKSIEKNPLAPKSKKGKPSVLPAHKKPSEKEVIENGESYMGSTNNPKVKGLPSHDGPKIRHNRPNTISRKDLRKHEQERKNPKLRRKRQRQQENVQTQQVEGGPSEAKKPKKANTSKKQKLKRKEEIKDLKDDKKFNEMVNKYKQKLSDHSAVKNVKSKWFQ